MQQPATRPRLLSPAARRPGTLLLSRHQPAGARSIRHSAAQRAAAFLRSAGLNGKNGCFCVPRVDAERQGKPVGAAMMPPSRPVPPVPPAAGATAGAR